MGGPVNELALFAGAGGGILGGHLLGWRTRCAVEVDPYARAVLLARQRDRCLPRFPIWDDVRTFDGRPWRGSIDIVTGGFPCQDISAAGKGVGITGERSGLWKHMARIIGEVRPQFAWVENSPMLVGRGLAVVLGDLAEMGYDARWGIVGADDAGAPHKRERIWILAHATGWRRSTWGAGCGQEEGGWSRSAADGSGGEVADAVRAGGREGCGEVGGEASHASVGERRKPRAQPCDGREAVANTTGIGCERSTCSGWETGSGAEHESSLGHPERPGLEGLSRNGAQRHQPGRIGEEAGGPTGEAGIRRGRWWATEPNLGRVVDGLAAPLDIHGAYAAGNVARVGVRIPKRADRLRCIGNGQVPAALVLAWRILNDL